MPLVKEGLMGRRALPLHESRRWFRSFSSLRHFARRLENQTWRNKYATDIDIIIVVIVVVVVIVIIIIDFSVFILLFSLYYHYHY